MSEKVDLRWKTDGVMTESMLREATLLAARPRYVRVVEFAAGIVLSACLIFLLIVGVTSGNWLYAIQVAAIVALYVAFTWGSRKLAMNMAVKTFLEQVPDGRCKYSAAFLEDGVYVHNGSNDAKTTIAYAHFARLIQVEDIWVLLTKMKSIVPIFQAQLSGEERTELLTHLQTVCPRLKNELKESVAS